jgi:hypothetical protein
MLQGAIVPTMKVPEREGGIGRSMALSYHSPTEWVMMPEVVALYDHVVINKDVYDSVIEEGRTSRASEYCRHKADCMRLLHTHGLLEPREYAVAPSQHACLRAIFDNDVRIHCDELRRLAVSAHRTYIQHARATADLMMNEDDPRRRDIYSNIPRWTAAQAALQQGALITEVPRVIDSLFRYYENCILTPILFPDATNPVLDWEGYAPFEEWFLHRRANTSEHARRIRKGSVVRVFETLTEIALPFKPIFDERGVESLLAMHAGFGQVRALANRMNHHAWERVQAATTVDGNDPYKVMEFVREFEAGLGAEVGTVNQEIQRARWEVVQRMTTTSSKIVLQCVGAIGSTLPVVGKLVEDTLTHLYRAWVEGRIEHEFPAYGAVKEYERNLGACLGRVERRPVTYMLEQQGGPYESQEFWS